MGRTDEFCRVRPIVAFQGESGAFSEKAIEYLVEGPVKLLSCNTFDATTGAVVQGIADLGVIPVENLIAGPVHSALDALAAAPSSSRSASISSPCATPSSASPAPRWTTSARR